jgi:hypothetical protein
MTDTDPVTYEVEFQEWLVRARGLSERPARDVVSRLRRVRRFVDEHRIVHEPHAWAYAINHTELSQCTTSVRSQLKRAVMAYQEFLQAKRPQ